MNSVKNTNVWKNTFIRELSILVFSVRLSLQLIVDCENDSEIKLQISGATLNADTIKTPIIALSNYVFNGLREDAVNINNGTVSEAFVEVLTDRQYMFLLLLMCRETDPTDPEIINRMILQWSYKPIANLAEHYQESYLKPIIDGYGFLFHLYVKLRKESCHSECPSSHWCSSLYSTFAADES